MSEIFRPFVRDTSKVRDLMESFCQRYGYLNSVLRTNKTECLHILEKNI